MAKKIENEIRDLAFHMWKSAGEEYGRALDFWLMAEEMVLEVSAAAGELAQSSTVATAVNIRALPFRVRAAYASQVRQLAHSMWHAAGMQYGSVIDFWVAAERHILAVAERNARMLGSTVGAEEAVAKAFEMFSPEEYLEEVRRTAHDLWDSAGRPCGRALDDWLEAERAFLEARLTEVPIPAQDARRKWTQGAEPDAAVEPARKAAAAPAPSPTGKRAPVPQKTARAPTRTTQAKRSKPRAAKKDT